MGNLRRRQLLNADEILARPWAGRWRAHVRLIQTESGTPSTAAKRT
jgi:hypothetical protein